MLTKDEKAKLTAKVERALEAAFREGFEAAHSSHNAGRESAEEKELKRYITEDLA